LGPEKRELSSSLTDYRSMIPRSDTDSIASSAAAIEEHELID